MRSKTHRRILLGLLLVALSFGGVRAQGHEITVAGTEFRLDGKPFPFAGISFFNAIFNPAFNKSSEERQKWLVKFQRYGINVLRVWAQWDNARGFVDASPTATLYAADGTLNSSHLQTLKNILVDADRTGVIVELCLFSQESYRESIRLDSAASDRAVRQITEELLPYRNVVIQIWNEFTDKQTLNQVKVIKSIDPKRLVTNSPGYSGEMGNAKQNAAIDFLTPHTSRQWAGKHWEIAPKEIEYLVARFKKPVVDDEPARNGTSSFGGPKVPTSPFDQIVQILAVWRAGGYVVYHHDMFQLGYGSPSIPPSGIPDPEFSPYHRQVLEFLAQRARYMR